MEREYAEILERLTASDAYVIETYEQRILRVLKECGEIEPWLDVPDIYNRPSNLYQVDANFLYCLSVASATFGQHEQESLSFKRNRRRALADVICTFASYPPDKREKPFEMMVSILKPFLQDDMLSFLKALDMYMGGQNGER